ncbi:MAG TPA: DUF167 domain-containing protein [Blastocatellia bacterium]|nr:DUF167 domain-containing protein [Blastocatellia bacterium]
MIELNEKDGAVTFRARVQPRSSQSAVAGEHAGAVKLRIAAPPVDGKANQECRRFLAKLLGVSQSSVEIVAGDLSKDKLIRVRGVSAELVRKRFSIGSFE